MNTRKIFNLIKEASLQFVVVVLVTPLVVSVTKCTKCIIPLREKGVSPLVVSTKLTKCIIPLREKGVSTLVVSVTK